ncbi:DUF1707 SHOCT-like domain-containing protein [Streptosporangium sandarakinum]|uniref:DUF1707 domain-containing protein n=1 Tax=Streptosporangium sandarakinum TaxID=1260955 RepID=A0A852VBR8_9ACTN|nr:DUF1707 domain-containing protein [Streptosporangium sandarakinum]NYF44504.1 hypothetical protein [Streptosporangium sandarakinum]
MSEHPHLTSAQQVRPSDEDRDQVALRLQQAAAVGRIELTELDQRLSEIYQARTRGELAHAARGLPEPARTDTLVVRDEPGSRFAFSVFGWFSRRGRWVAPRVFTSLSMFGGGEIDLRDARFAAQEIRVRAFALWGYTEVVVPDDVEVEVKGFGLFGAFDRSAARSRRGAPRIVISGLALFGGVGTKAKAARKVAPGSD